MTDDEKLKADILWKLYAEHCVQGRHHEVQRSTVIGIVLAVSVAILGIATLDKGLSGVSDIALSLFLVFLGLFGAGFSLKHYERFNLHMNRARFYRDELDRMITNQPIKNLKDQADEAHSKEFPWMKSWRLYRWWVALNLAISTLGVSILVLAIWFPIIPPTP